MEDPECREEYVRADDGFALIEALVRARATAMLTQAELARRLGTTQSAIARLEGGRVSSSFATLQPMARVGTSTTVPIATGWSDSCRAGFALSERRCLCPAHTIGEAFASTQRK